MSELTNALFIEKYRPLAFEDLILEDKTKLLNYLNNKESLPSFIFYSNSPGTGKTSTAKLIAKELDCDILKLNASDERGIDTIRDKIRLFVTSVSTNGIKRCVFMDESDGMTKAAQDSLKSLMEEYSSNCFFIFTANDLNKIIEPIRSRCVAISFERPDKIEILAKILNISEKENIKANPDDIEKVVDNLYPDIRSMILLLQDCKLNNKSISISESGYISLLEAIRAMNIEKVYSDTYSGRLSIIGFTRWFFGYIFKNFNTLGIEKASKITRLLADIEKSYEIGVNLEVVFLANILEISKILKS